MASITVGRISCFVSGSHSCSHFVLTWHVFEARGCHGLSWHSGTNGVIWQVMVEVLSTSTQSILTLPLPPGSFNAFPVSRSDPRIRLCLGVEEQNVRTVGLCNGETIDDSPGLEPSDILDGRSFTIAPCKWAVDPSYPAARDRGTGSPWALLMALSTRRKSEGSNCGWSSGPAGTVRDHQKATYRTGG